MSNLVGATPEDTRVVNINLLLAVDPLPGDVQRWVAVEFGRNYLVQLLQSRSDICWWTKDKKGGTCNVSQLRGVISLATAGSSSTPVSCTYPGGRGHWP